MGAPNPLEHRYRYLILGIGCLCLTAISSNMLAFNMAQVCMASSGPNDTDRAFSRIDYTPSELSLINIAVGVGTALATLPFTEAYGRFGARWPFFVAGALSAGATALLPLAAEFHLYAVLALRVIQGISYAADFAAVGVLCSKWASVKQNGVFIAVLTTYSPLSSGITNSIGGIICESSFGWPMVFYSHAVASLFLFCMWLYFYHDKPQKCRKVTAVELEKIQRSKTDAQIHGGHFIPYKALLSDLVIWAIWLNAMAEIFSTNFFAVYAPYYMRNVLKYSIEKTGHFSAGSRMAQIPFRLVCGVLSDRIKFWSETTKLIVFNTITVVGAAVFYVGIGFVPDDVPFLAVLCIGMLNLVTGAACGGFYKQAVVYTRQYSHFVIANCQFLKCITLFLGPAMVAIFVHDESSKAEWRTIFLITAVALVVVSVIFYRYATSEPAVYTQDGYFDTDKTNDKTKISRPFEQMSGLDMQKA